jgi:hypothetical protein
MGLCKCPKRKVTNLFCYEHRVNVCEFCLVQNHQKCIVQSYLNWLKDSDFDSSCPLSKKDLGSVECVRLMCYHVFDWNALNNHFAQLPPTTAPAGFKCPICSAGIFPAENQAGPVAEALREKLRLAPWARVGLGLPLIEEENEESENNNNDSDSNKTWDAPDTFNPVNNRIASPLSTSTPNQKIVQITESEVVNRTSQKQLSFTQTETKVEVDEGVDVDEGKNKYQRRKNNTFLGKLIKAHEVHPKYSDDNDMSRKTLFVLLLVVLGGFTILLMLTKVGRKRAEHDPFLDPMNNPNIHNADINVDPIDDA